MESLKISSYKRPQGLPFPKRSIAVQVRLGSPSYIVFELRKPITGFYPCLLETNPIFGGELGEDLLPLTSISSIGKQLKLTLSLPFFIKKYTFKNQFIARSGENYGKAIY
jgi:hypothetical protein